MMHGQIPNSLFLSVHINIGTICLLCSDANTSSRLQLIDLRYYFDMHANITRLLVTVFDNSSNNNSPANNSFLSIQHRNPFFTIALNSQQLDFEPNYSSQICQILSHFLNLKIIKIFLL